MRDNYSEKFYWLFIAISLSMAIFSFSYFSSLEKHLEFFMPEDSLDYVALPGKEPQFLPKEDKGLEEIKLVFGGDVMLARHVQTIQENLNDYTSAWKDVSKLLNSADIAVVNLESPFAENPPYPREGFVFRARPENIIGMKFAGVDLVNLANNHFGNAGIEGMKYTFKILNDNDINYIGAGQNEDEAYQAKIIEIKNKKIGFLAQTYNAGYAASVSKPGVAVYDLKKLKEAITSLEHKVDFLIVQFHGGQEYTHQPNSQQVLFAHTAIDAGADLVIGHHPHWIQDIEKYKGKYIFYSLGNLIFDQNWSRKTSEGLLVKVILNDGLDFELLPVLIEDNYKPRLVPKDLIKSFSQIKISDVLN